MSDDRRRSLNEKKRVVGGPAFLRRLARPTSSLLAGCWFIGEPLLPRANQEDTLQEFKIYEKP